MIRFKKITRIVLKNLFYWSILFIVALSINIFLWRISLGQQNSNSGQMFDDIGERYNYCPSVIQDGETSRYIFYCANKDPGVIRDHIYYRKGIYRDDKWVWSSPFIALSPSENGWDSIHVCDPDVVKGTFDYNGHIYTWAMFYLGCDTLDNTHNQIGVALADDLNGPWIKWSGNPIVSYPRDSWWGVGQPSIINLDRKGKIILFYTRGSSTGTTMHWRKYDLSNMNSPLIEGGGEIPTDGLTEIDGSSVILHNGALAYDNIDYKLYLVRERHPFDNDDPSFISSQLQIAVTSINTIWNSSGTWKVLGNISSSVSGKPRNHNGCIVKDVYGNIPDRDYIEVFYTVAETRPFPACLWTYRIYATKIKINLIGGE